VSAALASIAEGLPATIELAFAAFVAAVVLGALGGFVRARARAPLLRGALAVPQLLGRALPVVVVALLLQLLLMFKTQVPIAGIASSDLFDVRDRLSHLIAPVLILALPFGAWASLVFFEFFRDAGDAALVSVRGLLGQVARTAASLGPALLAASVLIEPRFAWPGAGRSFLSGVSQLDLGMAAAFLLMYSAGIVLIKLCGKLAPAVPERKPPRPPDRKTRLSTIGICALVVLIAAALAAVAANLIAPIGPYYIDQANWDGYPLAPGVAGHVLGTEENGRDLLARLLVGMRTSLGIAALAALVATSIGALVAKAAKVAAWFGGRDALSVTGIRPFAAFPFILAIVALLVAIRGTTNDLNPLTIALIIAAVSWPAIVPAFRARGPATAGGVVDLAACALLLEITMSIGGFGVQPPTPSLGNMLVNAQSSIAFAPWIVLAPTVVIVVMLFALYTIGDELRDAGRS